MVRITCISNRLAEINFHNQYCSGEKNFNQAQLDNVNLSNKKLTDLNLRQANLNYSTLEKISLSYSDLSDSSLISVNFRNSSLENLIFNRANLSNAKLSLSKITAVSFFGSCLYRASFCGAEIDDLDFSFANLSSAYLAKLDLRNSIFQSAIYDSNTEFPQEFDPEAAGMIHESKMFDLDQISSDFNRLYQRAKTLLGETITVKYLDCSRPVYEGLNKLTTDKKSKLLFKQDAIMSLNNVEAEYLRNWMIAFANSCHKIVGNVENDEDLFASGIFS